MATIALVKGHSWIAAVDAIFLVCVGEIEEDLQVEKHSFGLLIRRWMKNVPEPIPTQHFPDLRAAIDEWRKRRNEVVHGMVKSIPGAVHNDVFDFLKEADFVALQGEALAHALSNWVKKSKRQFRQAKERSD